MDENVNLSKTSKMPCKSWSTEACVTCNRGKLLSKKKGSVCSGCYAQKGFYVMPSVKTPRQKNLAYYNQSPNKWANAMIDAIGRAKYFRWFDSGDVKNTEMLKCIIKIAQGLPDCQFWLPTHESIMVNRFLINGGHFPTNLVVRVSADMVEEKKHYVGVVDCMVTAKPENHRDVFICPATVTPKGQKVSCGKCRECWNQETQTIGYKLH